VAVRSVGDLRELGDGVTVMLSGQVVSASFQDCFYVQQSDRSCGIKVVGNIAPQRGDIVEVTGMLRTAGCERYIQASSGRVLQPGVAPTPLGAPNRALGGARALMVPGVAEGIGLNNVGLLMRSWGTVSRVSGTQPNVVFYIDDGSHTVSDLGRTGIKVYSPGPAPEVGRLAVVTGVVTCEEADGSCIPVLRVRDASDVLLIY